MPAQPGLVVLVAGSLLLFPAAAAADTITLLSPSARTSTPRRSSEGGSPASRPRRPGFRAGFATSSGSPSESTAPERRSASSSPSG